MIHPTALVDSAAKLADDVSVGPYSIIGPEVEIGSGTQVGPHVVIQGPSKIGKNNRFFQFASIGEDPQDLKFRGGHTSLEIGDNNVFRESTTVHRGTEEGGSVTKIGNNNLFMAYAHIAHDCIVGNHNIFSNNGSIAGHVLLGDHVIISGFAAVHQFCQVGSHSFVARATYIIKDVLPYVIVEGTSPTKAFGINKIGLKRRGFSDKTILNLSRAYKIIFRKNLNVPEALNQLEPMLADCPEIQAFIDGLNKSERGIIR